MFKKFFCPKFWKRRGQALVLYALLIPLLFLFVGVGMDLGWYYLNVSRLQNAADAAALAGAQALVKQEDFNNYLVISLASNELPADFDDYKDVFSNTFDSSTSASGVLHNYKKIDEVKPALRAGRAVAEAYTRKNLEDATEVNVASNSSDTVSATDGWSISSDAANKKVSGKIELKYKIVDGKNDVYGPLYYVVNLTEKIRHFFLPGWFDDMAAPVRAVVLLKPHYKGLIEPMEQLERTQVIDNWEYAKQYRGTTGEYAGKWNHYQAGTYSDHNHGVKYTSGNPNRTESVIVKTTAEDSSGATTLANGGNFYSANKVDSINIDMRAEVTGKFTSDWDIGYAFPETGHGYQFAEGWSKTDGSDKRILFNAEFDEAFPTRDESKQADPLWVRIESDPLKNPYTGAGVSNFNSVRQVTLNFNDDNTIVEGNHYKYRPYVVFYDGPENIDYTTANGVLIRHSQPAVINLNEDLNAIFYMPESPVIINGNGHALHGFVIAKCFLNSVTAEDMLGTNSITLYDGFNEASTFSCGFTEGTDGNDNTVYFKPDDLLDKDKLKQDYPEKNFDITKDSSGKVTVTEKLNINHYILLNYTKADSTNYEFKTNGIHDENKTFAAYVNATYKEKYKAISGLTDSQITAVSFRNENYNETTATYYVANEYISASKVNDNYVKVLVNGSPMYADKTKLPYVKVRFNTNYFYVCVSDLQLLKNSNGNENGNKGVRMVDNSYTDEQMNSSFKQVGDVTSTDADIYIVTDSKINKNGDSWKIDRAYWDKNGNWKNWTKDKVEFAADGSYFMLKSEMTDPIATYQKITYTDGGKEKVKYAKEGDKLYYTKVYNNTNNLNNYIIVDENGNILTKPVTAPEVLKDSILTKTENDSIISRMNSIWGRASDAMLRDYWKTYTREPNKERPREIPGDKGGTNGEQYVGLSEYRKDEDYRIPALERVYLKSTFNLNDNSYYSYFDIDDLWRVNYTYLNVNEINHTVNRKPVTDESLYDWKVADMFFTMTRAGWID